MTNAKKSNIIYAAFLAVLIPLLIIFIAFSKAASRQNFTLDYDIVFEIGSYNVKVTECTFDENEETITFIFKYKLKEEVVEPSNSEPVVDSVISNYEKSKEELAFSTESISKDETKVICTGVPKNIWYITVNLYSKDFDYTDPDTVDEFGDTIKGKTHEGKEHHYYLQIDEKDMNKKAEETSSVKDSSSSDSSNDDNFKVVNSTENTTTTSQTSSESTTNSNKTTSSASKKITESSFTSTKSSTSTMASVSTKAAMNNTSKATAKPVQTTKATTRATAKTTSKATTKATVKTTSVANVKAEALSLKTGYAANNVTLKVGQSAKVEAVLTPSSASGNDLVWSSNKPQIATVDSKGNIKAVSPGRAIIVVKTKNGNLSAACMVTVS